MTHAPHSEVEALCGAQTAEPKGYFSGRVTDVNFGLPSPCLARISTAGANPGRMRTIVILLAMQVLIGTALFACSSDEPARGGDGGEAGIDAPLERRPPTDVAVDDASSVCAPQPIQGTPRFVPPRPWYQDACTAAQINGYVSSCLVADTSVCDAFKQQNPTCFACIDSNDTDSSWGPVVRFADRSYSERNFPGCAANALGETGDSGCGAAEALYEDCRRLACRGCLPIATQADYNALVSCGDRPEANKICASYNASRNVKCGVHLDLAPNDPVTVCIGTGMGSAQYYRDLLALWCMPKPEGGLDGGDAGGD
jgi:hypothetical protein